MIKAQNDIRHQINRWIDSDSNDDNTQLAIPKKQEFAINNIQMNMTKKDVEAQLGQHKRIAYDFECVWHKLVHILFK